MDADVVAEPGFIQNLLEQVFVKGGLVLLARLFGPLSGAIEAATGLYRHYEEQGKAPVFLMTTVGLVALTAGFGYGLQYAFINVLSDALKVAVGFGLGVGVVALGCYISIKKKGYLEYGASVIGLGVVFNYLSAFFLGPYFGIVSDLATFAILVLITGGSYALARVFETRVVAVLTLVGGVLSPVLLDDLSLVNTAYVVYLLVLVGANLNLARKIEWEVLAQLGFLLTLGMLEHSAYGTVVGGGAALVLYLAFFNLFAYYWSFVGLKLKESLSRTELGFLTSNLFYLVYAVLTAAVSPMVSSIVLVLNAGLFVWLMSSMRIVGSVAAPMFMLMTGSLIAAAVFVVAPLNVLGMLWSAEGVALLYVGFVYRQRVIRIEGYAIFGVATLCLLWQVARTTNLTALAQSPWPWVDLLMMGVLLFAAYRLIDHFHERAASVEGRIGQGLNEAFTFWGVAALFVLASYFLQDAVFVLAVVPLLWCFHRTARHTLTFAPLVGFLLLVSFAYQIGLGMWDAGSRVLGFQTWLTWLAIAEIAILGVAIQWYYELRDITAHVSLARLVRYLSACVPMLLLVSALLTMTMLTLEIRWWVWLDLLIALIVLVGSRLVFQSFLGQRASGSEQQLSIVEETLSVAASVLFLYTVYLYSLEWMFIASALPFMALLYRGVGKQLRVTEAMAWGHLLVLGLGILLGFEAAGSIHLSDQTLVTKCMLAALLACAWGGQWVYQMAGTGGRLLGAARASRVIAYLVIPLIFLPAVNRHLPDYFPMALWASVAVCWLMHKGLGIRQLLIEMWLLFGIAVLSVVVSSLAALDGAPSFPALASITASLVILAVIHWREQALSASQIIVSDYRHMFWMSIHYVGFCVGAIAYAIAWNMSLAALAVGTFYAFVCYANVLRALSRASLSVSHALAWAFLSLGPVLSFLAIGWTYQALMAVLATVVLGLLVHARFIHNRILRHRLGGPTVQLYLYNVVVAACYLGVANTVFEAWSVVTTIVLLLHAVVVLFLTLDARFTSLLKLSLVLYAITAAKLLLHDLNDFGALVRVAALMAIGVILMVAAYYYQKLVGRQVAEVGD